MANSNLLHGDITDQIIKAFYNVYNTLGFGFLEKVYENSMVVALTKAGLFAVPQAPILVRFEGNIVGEYFADLIVNDVVVVEIKAAEAMCPAHEAQLLNYLTATGKEVGLLLNFGPKPQFSRKVMTRCANSPIKTPYRENPPHPRVSATN